MLVGAADLFALFHFYAPVYDKIGMNGYIWCSNNIINITRTKWNKTDTIPFKHHWRGKLIKSPQCGVTLCFQFVSAPASASAAAAAAMTFASHVKTFELDLRYFGQIKYVSDKMYWVTFGWYWPKVTTVTLINKNLLVCRVKSAPLNWSLQNFAAISLWSWLSSD